MTESVRIPLSGEKGAGLFALVDAEDVSLVSCYSWALNPNGYAFAHVRGRRSAKHHKNVLMHRLILSAEMVDHINRNPLDNRRCNLRPCNKAQNGHNGKKHMRGIPTSRFKGVSWRADRGKWRATIKADGRAWHLGYFLDEEAAARRYDLEAKVRFGEFAATNVDLGLLVTDVRDFGESHSFAVECVK